MNNNKKGSALVYVMILLAFSAIVSVGALSLSDHNIKMSEHEYQVEQAYLESRSGLEFMNEQFIHHFGETDLHKIVKDVVDNRASISATNNPNLDINLELINSSPIKIKITSTGYSNDTKYTMYSYATLDILANLKPLNVIKDKDKIEAEFHEDLTSGKVTETEFDPPTVTEYGKDDEETFKENHALNAEVNTTNENIMKEKFDNLYEEHKKDTATDHCLVDPNISAHNVSTFCTYDGPNGKKQGYAFLIPSDSDDEDIDLFDLTIRLDSEIADKTEIIYLYIPSTLDEVDLELSGLLKSENPDIPIVILSFNQNLEIEIDRDDEEEPDENDPFENGTLEGWIVAPHAEVELEGGTNPDNDTENNTKPIITGGIVSNELEIEAEKPKESMNIIGKKPPIIDDLITNLIKPSDNVNRNTKWGITYE